MCNSEITFCGTADASLRRRANVSQRFSSSGVRGGSRSDISAEQRRRLCAECRDSLWPLTRVHGTGAERTAGVSLSLTRASRHGERTIHEKKEILRRAELPERRCSAGAPRTRVAQREGTFVHDNRSCRSGQNRSSTRAYAFRVRCVGPAWRLEPPCPQATR